ncbi:low temperature requirement protein A [Plantactinospora sp. WMMB334]|uniref:low temperature requirement protein A n=1 Tax=Plantactinospora sp. WMMB334 TaxID=3404119 RepID=UPI003B94F271
MRPPAEPGVTWEELFFDLALVFALIQLSQVLHGDHSWGGIVRALILFALIYWSWVAATYHTDQRDINNAVDRLGLFTLALGNLLLALMISDAYGDRALSLVVVYLAIRVLLAVLALRNRRATRAVFSGPYGVGLVTGPLQLAGGFVGGTARPMLWGIAALIDMSGPWIARRALARAPVRPAHYAHRYGLLIILVLGESIIQVGMVASALTLTPVRMTTVGIAFTLVCGLWWVYFIYGGRAFREALERPDAVDIRRSVLVHGHLSFGFAIILTASGLAGVVSAPVKPLPKGEAWLLCAGCALFVGTFVYTHWRIHRQIAWRRIGAAVACLAVWPLALHMPAMIALAGLSVVIVVVNLLEEAIIRHRPAAQPGGRRGSG